MLRLLVILLISVCGFFIFLNTRPASAGINSPIPKVFGTSKEKAFLNTWFPKAVAADNQDLYLTARSAIAVDYESGDVIFAREVDEELPIASTLKIMTALVVLETTDPSTKFVVSEKAATVGENSMGLAKDERLTVEDLVYGLMLVSGNDAAVAIAEGVAGSEDAFVAMMNEKAEFLGLENTHFANSTGLDADEGNSYSTVYDMAVISRYVWENSPLFREISSTAHLYIEATDEHKDFDLYNDTNLLTTYPGVKGIKPGFTWEAGLCLVTYAENDGKKILAVILGSDDRRGEMKELLDYSFTTYGINVSHPGLDF